MQGVTLCCTRKEDMRASEENPFPNNSQNPHLLAPSLLPNIRTGVKSGIRAVRHLSHRRNCRWRKNLKPFSHFTADPPRSLAWFSPIRTRSTRNMIQIGKTKGKRRADPTRQLDRARTGQRDRWSEELPFWKYAKELEGDRGKGRRYFCLWSPLHWSHYELAKPPLLFASFS